MCLSGFIMLSAQGNINGFSPRLSDSELNAADDLLCMFKPAYPQGKNQPPVSVSCPLSRLKYISKLMCYSNNIVRR